MSISLNAKIPFQPGLALGSIVRGDIIEKIEKYGETLSVIENAEKQMQRLEKETADLDKKIKVLNGKGNKQTAVDQKLVELFTLQKTSLTNASAKLLETLTSIKDFALPFFSNITTGLESPIDFDITPECYPCGIEGIFDFFLDLKRQNSHILA